MRVQEHTRKSQAPSRPGHSSPNVTSAVGLAESTGRFRARRNSLFTQTVIWVTGLICLVLLLGSLAQAWSNSQLMLRVQAAQQQTQQIQQHHDELAQLATYYQNPFVIEREAREQLGYIRPGEYAVVIVSSPEPGQPTISHRTSAPAAPGFWQEWWNVFFGG